MLQGHVASDYGWLVILSAPGRFGGDEPGVEAIGGCVHKWRALNTRLSSGTSKTGTTSNRTKLNYNSPGGWLWEGEGNGNYSPFRGRWSLRLGIVEMQIEILNGGEILVNCKIKITIWICTGRYRGIQIQSTSQFEFVPRDTMNLSFSISTSWLKSPHHSGFRFAFRRSFRVSSTKERSVPERIIWFPVNCKAFSVLIRWPINRSNRFSDSDKAPTNKICRRAPLAWI